MGSKDTMSFRFSLTRRHLVITALAALAVTSAGVTALQRTTQAAVAENSTEERLVALTNDVRVEHGLAPLAWNSRLYQAATARAADMFDAQYFDHVRPDGQTPWPVIAQDYPYADAGENLAIDFTNPIHAVPAWMDSPSHRANLLDPAFKDTAVVIVPGVMQGRHTTIIVQLFGSPR